MGTRPLFSRRKVIGKAAQRAQKPRTGKALLSSRPADIFFSANNLTSSVLGHLFASNTLSAKLCGSAEGLVFETSDEKARLLLQASDLFCRTSQLSQALANQLHSTD